ncbi:hypothetical protein [Hydrogenimonas sp.]
MKLFRKLVSGISVMVEDFGRGEDAMDEVAVFFVLDLASAAEIFGSDIVEPARLSFVFAI